MSPFCHGKRRHTPLNDVIRSEYLNLIYTTEISIKSWFRLCSLYLLSIFLSYVSFRATAAPCRLRQPTNFFPFLVFLKSYKKGVCHPFKYHRQAGSFYPQGCVLSPFICFIFMDFVLRSTPKIMGEHGFKLRSEIHLDIIYANDLSILDENVIRMNQLLEILEVQDARVDLKIECQED